jgi:hypothetical protein
MNTEKRVRLERVGRVGRYENLETFMEDASRLRSETVCGLFASLFTPLGRVFGNLTAPSMKETGHGLPTAGAARPGAAV